MSNDHFKCIGRIKNIPDYAQWATEQAAPTNINTALMLPEVRQTRIAIRTKIATELAQRHGYDNTDVVGEDPLDYTKWKITDYSVVHRIADLLGLTKAIGRVQIQSPGQMVMPHCDDLSKTYVGELADVEHYHHVSLDAADRARFAANPRSATRILIMLQDWRIGQGFGTEQGVITHWQRGDIFAWDWPTVVHSTFNNGYWPRPLLRITGMTTDRWQDLLEADFTMEYQ
jgi:hypothetical protein